MATGFGTGFDIDKLERAIKSAETGLKSLITTGDNMEKSITNNFKRIASEGVGHLSDSIDKLNKSLEKIGSEKSDKGPFKGVNKDASSAIDKANKFLELMSKINNDGASSRNSTALTKINEEIDVAKKRLGELQNILNFYAKGEGQKALGFANTTDVQKEAKSLVYKLDALEREKASIQANDRLKAEIHARQIERSRAWYQMEEERNRVLRARAKEESRIAKQVSKDYKKSYDERYQAYLDMFNKIEGKQHANRSQSSIANEGSRLFNSVYGEDGYKSIANMVQAIDDMRRAQNNLNLNTEEGKRKYKELGDNIKRTEDDLKEYGRSAGEVNNKHKQLINTGDQLKRALAGVFSISAIKGYITKLIDVRGEFELQHRSLQAIVQDVDKANKLWDKTIALAVKSPFRVKDLVTYTKQLAAYRVETDKLYDTTRMLADVSAGLGVDMNRLILAYGQVKAATYLRGTELRQFTEAGIPMLDELAKYFTELENRFVSASDVFDRISKRGVTFEDVDVVFKKITGEGGVFYKMQEKQAETLKGMINNLRDSIDLMLNEIGTSQEESLKCVISATKDIVENWRAVAVLIKQVGFAAVISALRNLVIGWNAVTLATFEGTAAMTGATKAGATLRLSLQKLYDTMKANPWAFIIGGIVAAGHAMWNYKKAIEEVNKKYDELSVSEIKKIDKLNASLDKVNDSVEKNNSVLKNSKSTEEELASARESNLRILNQLKTEYPDVFKAIVQQKDGTIQLSNAVEEQNRKLRANIALQQEAKAKWNRESQGKNYKDVIEAQGNLQSQIDKTKVGAYQLGVKIEEAIRKGKITRDEAQPLLDYMEEIKKANNATDILRKGLAVTSFNDKAVKAVDFYKFRDKHLKELEKMRVRYEGALRDLGVNLDEQMATFKIEMSEMETELERGEWLKAQLENLGILDAEIQKWAKDYIESKIELKIVFPDPAQEVKDLEAWQNTYNEKFGDKEATKEIDPHKGFVKIQNKNTKQSAVVERLQAEYKETKELIERIEAAGGEAATMANGAYEGLNLSDLRSGLEQIKEQIEWFGAPLEKKQKKSIEILNRRISLIKEMYEEYNKVHKEATASDAERDVAEAYRDTFIEAFEGTGIDFSKLVINKEELNNLIEAGDEAGSAFSDAMLAKIRTIEEAGTYIRNFTEELVPFTQNYEKFIPYAYYDQDKWVNGKPPKASESTTKKGTLTIGTGITNNSGIDYKFDENATLTEAKNQELLNKILQTKVQRLNKILDKNKELILTQEQYNMLLDQFYQGEAGTEKAINIAQGDWEGFEKYLNTIKQYKQLNKEHVIVDIDSIKEEWDALDTLQEKLALAMKWTNITTKQTKKVDGKDVTERFISSAMQERSIARSQVFSGDLEVVKLLQKSAIDVSKIDFTNIEGVIAILKKLKPIAEKEGQEAELALSRAISEFEAELNIKPKIEERESIERSIDELFGNYEISLEMNKLNIPSDFASKMFGFESVNLDDIRKKILDEFDMGDMALLSDEHIFSSEQFKNLSEERQKLLKESLKKEDKLQNKHLEDNLKKYIEYSKKALSERAKIKVDEINHLREIEETFMATTLHDIETARALGVSEEEIARMEAENAEISERNKLLSEYKTLVKSAVAENSQQDMKKIEWDEFRSSDVFINMFSDLDKASESLIKKSIERIEEFKKTWKDMPVAAAKEMTKRLNELQLALYDSGRVGRDKRAIEKELNDEIELRGLKGKANTTIGQKNLSESVQGENQAYTELIEKSNQRIALLQIINDLKSENKALDLELLGYNEEYIAGLGLTADIITNSVNANNELIKTEKQNITNLNVKVSSNQKILNLIDKQKTKAAQLGEKWSKALGMAKDLYTSFQDLAEAANWDFSDEMAIFGEMGVSMADAVTNAIALSSQLAAVETGAIAAGTALNTALGIVGWIVMAVQLVVSALNAISEKNQEERAEQIEEEIEKVEALAKKYEKLEESINNAFSSGKLAQDSIDAQDNLQAQIESMENAISVYEDADYDKLSDEEIEDWESKKEELEELKEQAAELKETVFSIATAGVFDDISSASDDFVDAWLTAFEETEEGMSGLEESFDDMLKTTLKKQMSMAIMGPVMEQWKQSLGKYVNDKDTILTAEEAGQWAKEVKDSFGAVNANLQAYAEALESEGINLHEDKENSLSGLSGGISGITEEQADILSAYWNAVRLSTSNIENELYTVSSNILKLLSEDKGDNPIVGQLKEIASYNNKIYTLLDQVLASSGSTSSGTGFRVFAKLID